MSEMIPYLSLFKEQALRETRDVTFKGNPLIPDDSYGLLEFYCPDPGCDCNMVMIGVLSKRLVKQVATMVYYFDPNDVPTGMANPDLDLAPQISFAENLLKWFTAHLKEDPAYAERLKKHYRQVKDVASNPSHPGHEQYQEWLSFVDTNNLLQEDEPQKPTKKKFSAEKSLFRSQNQCRHNTRESLYRLTVFANNI